MVVWPLALEIFPMYFDIGRNSGHGGVKPGILTFELLSSIVEFRNIVHYSRTNSSYHR